MAHLPVNHRFRFVYRTVAGLAGAYIVTFGMCAVASTAGLPFFAQDGLPRVLGLQANRAFGVLSIVAGSIVVGGALIGRNIDRWINLVGGQVFLAAGLIMMLLMQTTLNLFGFTIATCVASFLIGMVLLIAGLYGQVGSAHQARREEHFRHGGPEPQTHIFGTGNKLGTHTKQTPYATFGTLPRPIGTLRGPDHP